MPILSATDVKGTRGAIASFPSPHHFLLPYRQSPIMDTLKRWSNSDLDPTPESRRIWSMWSLSTYWLSDQCGPGTWTAGATLITLGWTAKEAIPYAFIGAACCGIMAYYNAMIGSKTHCCFPVIIRASFGPWAALVPVFVRALIWLIVLSFQAADCVTLCIAAIWPSYNTAIKNTFSPDAGVTTQQLVSMIIYWLIQTPISLVRVERLKYFFAFKAVVVPIAFFGLLIWGIVITDGGKTPYITGSSGPFSPGLTPCEASTASTIAVNIPDFSRYQRPTRYQWTQLIVVPVTGTIPVMCAIIATSAAQSHYGAVDAWQPSSLIGLFGDRAVRFFVSAAFLIAYIGVNISANSVSFANDFSSICPRYFNIRRAGILAAILIFLGQPWDLLKNAGLFLNFLGAYGSFLSGVAAIMACDFWIVRKGKLDVPELYKPGGRYWYWHGINPRAVAAWIISFAPNLPGLISAVNPAIKSVNPYTYSFSWFFGTFVAGGCYWAFCKIWPPHASFVDEAVWDLAAETSPSSSSDAESKKEEESTYVLPVKNVEDRV
ncbi:permease for cytosine/purines, uracil, thiamine, allantoin-domain-containing protein [Leucosporidium creatinivorum]|uniref:Permease for cytosine/purines, uracil, thiamine, allantoin-domain-containing protein n=1 Tax=Leucosporidium creatinivorum TaxID=106004 RepID=A0A1Y2G4C1_9BASI|nr:permease for cytosine/purines, uracil, thiamine, allantoin-domain-containing protein [Leucosporidium creatinivorum]